MMRDVARPQAPHLSVTRWVAGGWRADDDYVAAEEPLQLLVDGEPWSIVMRTPGSDVELALGLMYGERIIRRLADVERLEVSAETDAAEADEVAVRIERVLLESNAVDVRLAPGASRPRPARTLPVSSACGICGQTTLDDLAAELAPVASTEHVDPALLPALPAHLRSAQGIFDRTGGLHAAGLFSADGEAIAVREDIGRHNAVDKVVGRSLLDGLRTSSLVLAVSGRVGFEVVQKAIAAGIPVVVAVGAPSSLAVEAARRFGLTLVGFLRDERFNVYSGFERLSSQ
jgi:FdhD protein